MQLPFDYSSTLLVHIEPTERFVNLTNTGLVKSVVNKANGSLLAQPDPTLQPKIDMTGINGFPAIVFSGNQSLKLPMTIGTKFSLPLISIMIAKCSDTSGDLPGSGGTAFALGSANPGFSAFAMRMSSTSAMGVRGQDDGGASDSTDVAFLDATKAHVYTTIYDGTNFTMRVDGKTVVTTPLPLTTTGFQVLDQMCIGNLSAGYGFDLFFTGAISSMVLYQGTTFFDAEEYMMARAGLGTNRPFKK